jgi:hypothetical protein
MTSYDLKPGETTEQMAGRLGYGAVAGVIAMAEVQVRQFR